MRFWDSSALAPLILPEATSQQTREWLAEDQDVVVWALTRLELASAIERKTRQGALSRSERRNLLSDVTQLVSSSHEVVDLAAVRARALALLARHPLRAADAAQLAAALLVADPDPASFTMVVLDQRLAEAAEREGLQVLTLPN